MGMYEGTHANGRRGMIATTRENFSAPGANLTTEQWESIFGKKEKKESYHQRKSFGRQIVDEEWWVEGGESFYRLTIDGKVMRYVNETTGQDIKINNTPEE